jgi:hypothetical protein
MLPGEEKEDRRDEEEEKRWRSKKTGSRYG